MARIRFKRPKIAILMSEVIALTMWLFLGERVIDVLDELIGTSYEGLNFSQAASPPTTDGCDNDSVFEDAWEIMGIGYSCEDFVEGTTTHIEDIANADNGLLGVIGLVMVVMVLMNFVTYN